MNDDKHVGRECSPGCSLQTEASGGVEGHTAEERVWIAGGDLGSGLRQGGEPGWRGHLGGATPLQTGVRLLALMGKTTLAGNTGLYMTPCKQCLIWLVILCRLM